MSLNSLYEVLNIHILSNIKIIKQGCFHQVSYAYIKIIDVKKINTERKYPKMSGNLEVY